MPCFIGYGVCQGFCLLLWYHNPLKLIVTFVVKLNQGHFFINV